MQDETDTMGVHAPFPDFGLLPPLRFKSKAGFLTYYYPTHLIVITDLDRGDISVTNDIENVLYDINMLFVSTNLGDFLAECVVIYRDSEGIWDQVLISKDGKFAGFESINKKQLSDAVKTVCGNDYDEYKHGFAEVDEFYESENKID